MHLRFSLRPALVLASAVCVAVVTAWSVWRRRQTPALAAGLAAYVAFILPVSGLTQTGGQAVADRYAYMAMVPLLLLAGGAVVWLCRRGPVMSRFTVGALVVIELVYFGVRTRAQIPVWHDDEALWRGVLAQYPDSDLANELVAQALLDQNRVEEALAFAQRAVKAAPSAETHRNLGIALIRADRIREAIAEFDVAVRLNPNLADAHYNLGIALMRLDQLTEAMEQWEQTIRIQPDYVEAHYNLGVALMKLGRMTDAIGHWDQALRLKPDYAEVHYNLGLALVRQGRVSEAIVHWEEALRIQPDYAEAHANLGVALEQQGKLLEALRQYEQAVQLKPNLADAHYNLGVVLMKLGNVPEAMEHWERALQLKPDMAAAHYNLGLALEGEGKTEEAIQHYDEALRIRPGYEAAQNRLIRLREAAAPGATVR
jgi:tetratricopeptide (TPR) repeat protein